METSPLARLLAQIERSGSGSAAFWSMFWQEIGALSDSDLRRLLAAVGLRGLIVRQALAATSVGA